MRPDMLQVPSPIDGDTDSSYNRLYAQLILYRYNGVSMAVSLALDFFLRTATTDRLGLAVVALHCILLVYFYLKYRHVVVITSNTLKMAASAGSMIMSTTAGIVIWGLVVFMALAIIKVPEVSVELALSICAGFGAVQIIARRSLSKARQSLERR